MVADHLNWSPVLRSASQRGAPIIIEQPEAGYRRARSGDLISADEQELVLLQVPVFVFSSLASVDLTSGSIFVFICSRFVWFVGVLCHQLFSGKNSRSSARFSWKNVPAASFVPIGIAPLVGAAV